MPSTQTEGLRPQQRIRPREFSRSLETTHAGGTGPLIRKDREKVAQQHDERLSASPWKLCRVVLLQRAPRVLCARASRCRLCTRHSVR
eukprot:679800-Amphidinium_carterae.1